MFKQYRIKVSFEECCIVYACSICCCRLRLELIVPTKATIASSSGAAVSSAPWLTSVNCVTLAPARLGSLAHPKSATMFGIGRPNGMVGS